MRKETPINIAEIVEREGSHFKLIDGSSVPVTRVNVLTETAIQPVFKGISYAGTESNADMPHEITIPTGIRATLPA